MKILVVIGAEVNTWPPIRNLIEILLRNNHIVTLMGEDKTGLVLNVNPNYRFIKIPEFNGTPPGIRYFRRANFMRQHVTEEMLRHDILWTGTDSTVRDLGDVVLKYRHVMQLLELIRDIPRWPRQNIFDLNIKKYALKAFKVVVPEYNRAHIQQAWWSLPELPTVLPNRMSVPEFDKMEIPADVLKVVELVKREKRRIILYQGVFYNDRNLDYFVEAIAKLKNEYVLYLMGKETDYKKRLCSAGGDAVVNIPYIKPPFHLLITKYSYIGLLPYKAAYFAHYAKINALYCAPNKLFEYAAYGLPMIGTDMPGLILPFYVHGIGYVCRPYTVSKIIENIALIDANYSEMSSRCIQYYNSFNMDQIVNDIINVKAGSQPSENVILAAKE